MRQCAGSALAFWTQSEIRRWLEIEEVILSIDFDWGRWWSCQRRHCPRGSCQSHARRDKKAERQKTAQWPTRPLPL